MKITFPKSCSHVLSPKCFTTGAGPGSLQVPLPRSPGRPASAGNTVFQDRALGPPPTSTAVFSLLSPFFSCRFPQGPVSATFSPFQHSLCNGFNWHLLADDSETYVPCPGPLYPTNWLFPMNLSYGGFQLNMSTV